MEAPERCPESGSDEMRVTSRRRIPSTVSSRQRCVATASVGIRSEQSAPPADRSKNLTLSPYLLAPEHTDSDDQPAS